MNWLADFNQICMDITLGHDDDLILVTLTYFSRSLQDFQAKRCLCAQYLMSQVCMDITFGRDKKLKRFW